LSVTIGLIFPIIYGDIALIGVRIKEGKWNIDGLGLGAALRVSLLLSTADEHADSEEDEEGNLMFGMDKESTELDRRVVGMLPLC